MSVAKLLGVLVVYGLVSVGDAACDAQCQGMCRSQMAMCRNKFYAARMPAQAAQQRYFAGHEDASSNTKAFLAIQAICEDPENNLFDSCSAIKDLWSCVEEAELETKCREFPEVANEVAEWKSSALTTCGSESTCFGNHILKCQCFVHQNMSDYYGSICNGFVDFQACMHSLPDHCQADHKAGIDDLVAAYSGYFYLRCLDYACPAAVDCTEALAPSETVLDPNFQGIDYGDGYLYTYAGGHLLLPGRVPDQMMPTVCAKQDVFTCLKTASASCNTDLGAVSFDNVIGAYSDACSNVLPNTISPTITPGVDNCESFLNCLMQFDQYPKDGDSIQTYAYFMASTTRTDFWCRWLKHNYQCVIDTKDNCGVQQSTIEQITQKLQSISCDGATKVPAVGCDSTCVGQCYTKLSQCGDLYTTALQPFKVAQENYMAQQRSQNTALAALGNFSMALQQTCENPDNIFDGCGALTQVKQCIDENIGLECYLGDGVKDALSFFLSNRESACRPDTYCYTKHLLKCQCKVLRDVTNPLGSVCDGFAEMKSCMDNLPEMCRRGQIKRHADYAVATYRGYYYLHCSDSACPAAVQCTKTLEVGDDDKSDEEHDDDRDAPSEDGYVHPFADLKLVPEVTGVPDPNMPSICPIPGSSGKLSVFDCLKNATGTCNINQGNVTFENIKNAFNVMCTDMLPQVPQVINCQPFLTCLTNFEGGPNITALEGLGEGDVPSPEALMALYRYVARLTRTGFWCSWLKHNYQCAIDHASTCGLSQQAVTLATQQRDSLVCEGAATPPPPTTPAPNPPPTTEDTTGGAAAVHTTLWLLVTVIVGVIM